MVDLKHVTEPGFKLIVIYRAVKSQAFRMRHIHSHACFGFPQSDAVPHKFAVPQPSLSTKVLTAA